MSGHRPGQDEARFGADEVRTVRRSRGGWAEPVRAWVVAVVVLAVLGAGGCQPDARRQSSPPERRAVVVASFSFPESTLLAEIYAQALEAAGVPVRRELDLGPRELVMPALQQGAVDLVPEYLGTALATVSPDSTVDRRDPDAVRAALDRAVRHWGLRTLEPAPASNQNGLVVTSATASRLGVRTISGLQPVAPRLTFGGTPECPAREYCLVGLRRVYGLRFADFVPFERESQRVAALEQRLVDVALMFTTDGYLATGDLVLLRDDRDLQPAENVVPVVSARAIERHGQRVVRTLNAVSSQLTTQNLVFLNWRVGVAGKKVPAEARGWLRRHGLLTPGR
jgi:osmoprotectant transport system substrate-binding protein